MIMVRMSRLSSKTHDFVVFFPVLRSYRMSRFFETFSLDNLIFTEMLKIMFKRQVRIIKEGRTKMKGKRTERV